MKFRYKSQTKDHEIVEGIIEAPDKFTVAKQLRDKGELPVSVTEYTKHQWLTFSFSTGSGFSAEDKVLFCRNLSGMLTAGLALRRAIEVLRKQSQRKKMNEILDALIAEIDKGGTFSSGLAKFPRVFSPLFVAMVRAGEESGGLSNALRDVGAHIQKAHELARKIKGAMTYPLIITGAVIGVGILMLIMVVPTLTKTFAELNVVLPASTRFIIALSNLLTEHTFFLIAAVLLLGTMGYFLTRVQAVKDFLDRVLLRLPLIGVMAKEVNSARTARTLSSLLSAGIDVTRAMTITQEVLQNSQYKKLLGQAITDVEKGMPLSEAFRARPDLYPVMVGEMMSVGEETGRLTNMLADVATFYEEEVDTKTKNLSTIIEPALMIIVGAAVGFFAVSMITPMYSLVNTI